MRSRLCVPIVALSLVGIFVSGGCTIKATIDTSTDGTSEFLSSTTGKSWWTEDGLVKRKEKVRAFVAISHGHLLQDIAKGHGEYVTALGNLLKIPEDSTRKFQTLLQSHYTDLAVIPVHVGREEMNQFLQIVYDMGVKPMDRVL